MKLLFLSHDSGCTGGAQKCLLDLLKGIKKNYPDCQIYMVFPTQGDLIEACSPYLDGFRIIKMKWWLISGNHSITIKKKLSYGYKLLRSTIKLVRYLHEIRPDYGITNTIVVPQLAISCKLSGIKHYWFIHEIPDATWRDNRFLFNTQTIFRLVDKLSIKVLVPSEYASRFYQSVMAKDKIRVMTQAVELSFVVNANQGVVNHEHYTILLVGAFDSNKGQIELLQAVKVIADRRKEIYCYLVGHDTGLMLACQEYIRKNDLDKYVEIVPFTEYISQYYNKADVLLVCSTLESFGRVAVEAQMCGLPVILSNVGANPERIENGVNGLLYQKGDVNDLVEKIEILREVTVRKAFSENIDISMLGEKYSTDSFAIDFLTLMK